MIRAVCTLAVVLLGAVLLAGCSSTPDRENQASRPWGAPQGWEGGIPSTLTEGR
jgi:hypothetical protein